ncbi:MAG: AI-2E family transporter [Leptospirales bacterium]|nr:AI-2E family transporter [Leptospirales bacterium]
MNERNSYNILLKNKTMKISFLILFAVILAFLVYIFRPYLWIFLYALIFYVALRPLHGLLLKYVKKRVISSSIIIFIIISLVIIPSLYLLAMLSQQIYTLYGKINLAATYDILKSIADHSFVDSILTFFEIEKVDLTTKILTSIKQISLSILPKTTMIVSYPMSFIINFFLMMLILFFLFKDAYNFEAAVYRILPLPMELEEDIVKRLKEVIYLVMVGNLLIMTLQGFLVGFGLFFAGIGTPLVWGTAAAILSLIPVIGTSLIWIPASIYLFAAGDYGMAIFVAVWSFLWYMILENIVKPKVFGDRLNFHPLLFFFLLLGSIHSFNLPGVIIGPIILSLFYSFWEIYKVIDDYTQSKKITAHKQG